MTRFREFVYSPYFNKHDEIRALVAYFSEIYPDFSEQYCNRNMIFCKIYNNALHDQPRLALLFTYTLRLLESFLALEQYQQSEYGQQISLLQALRLKKQYSFYEKNLTIAENKLENIHRKDSQLYNHQYQLAAEANDYFNQIERRQTDLSIQLKQNNLDKFYLLEKLKDACEMQVRRKILNIDYSARMLEVVVREVRDNAAAYGDEPLIYLYYQIHQMVVQGEHDYYFSALQTLQLKESSIAISELHNCYNFLQNYCIQQINRGEGRFLQEIFKLYQLQLAQGLLLEEGYLSEWHYKNIVTTGIRLGEMTWVKDFIEHYKAKLDPETRENAYRFNLASYYYAMQQYDQVLELLLQVEYNDLRYNLGAKALLLRTYYDLEEYDALFSLVQSFTLYLRRNKLMANFHREGHHLLFKFTRRAAQIRANIDFMNVEKARKEFDKLQIDIAAANAIFNKGWLLEKIQELEGVIG